jgi:hypothetical protein
VVGFVGLEEQQGRRAVRWYVVLAMEVRVARRHDSADLAAPSWPAG